jgi:hypothetical protein
MTKSKIHSFLVKRTLKIYLNKNGERIIKPKRCSKNIIVIGGKEYKFLRITPSKAQSNAATMISIGPMYDFLPVFIGLV